MIERHWRRLCGLHVDDDGTVAAVWTARDPDVDVIHLSDACVFRREVLAVIAEGINCRGRAIPVAWETKAKAMADRLLERGVAMLPEPYREDESIAEVTSRDIWERMRSGRFKVDKRLAEWLDEFRSFSRKDGKVPIGAFPLMSATRHAIAMLSWGKAQGRAGVRRPNYPKLAVV